MLPSLRHPSPPARPLQTLSFPRRLGGDRVVVVASLIAVAYVAAYLVASLRVAPDSREAQLLTDLVYMLPALIAAPLAIAVALRRGVYRAFWVLTAAALTAGLLGDVCWAVYDLVLGEAPVPSLADIFYLANVALTIPAAVICFPLSRRRWRQLTDMLVPLVAVLYAVYEFALEPQVAAGVTGATIASVSETGVAVLAALVFTALLTGYRDVPRSVQLVYAAVIAQAVSYPVYTYAVSVGSWQTVTWLYTGWQVAGAFAVLGGLVALRSPQRAAMRPVTIDDDVNVWMTTGGLVLVLIVVATKSHGGHLNADAPYVGLSVIVAVVLRLHQLVRQRGRLTSDLRLSLAAQERLATTDPLTDVANRRMFDEQVRAATAAAGTLGGSVGLVILDLDQFKRVNDGYGHPAGDETLQQVAARLRGAVRAPDMLARLGGEEFAVVAPQTDTGALIRLAERCRHAIATDPFTVGGNTIHLTTSIGAACFPADARDGTELVQVADRALYEAKRDGRNRVHAGPGAHIRTLPVPQNTVLSFLEELADELDHEQSEQEHSMAMLELAAALCDALGLSGTQRRRCLVAARFHDVGKVGIPRHILTKRGPLTEDEWKVMRDHVRIGVDLLSRCAETRDVAPIVAEHHERPDGRGYPAGRMGAAISIEAKVISAVDAWTAMLADRPYRAGLSPAEARAQLIAGRGSQFDERVVGTLLETLDRGAAARRAG